MRRLAKSFFRLSMAMTVFGAQQMRDLLRDETDETDESDSGSHRDRVAEALDGLSDDTRQRLNRRASSIYESGDKFQGEVVDLMFDSVDTDEWKPRRVLDRAAELAEKSADALRDAARDEDVEDGDAATGE